MDPIPHTRVLVVEDEPDNAELIVDLLRLRGFDARVAVDGPSALDLNHEFRADIALVDLGLPLMDGYEVARRLRELSSRSRATHTPRCETASRQWASRSTS